MIWVMIALAMIIVFFLVVNIIDMNRFVVRKYRVESAKIKAPYTIVFLSDLHDKSYGKKNAKLLREIDAIGPDLILCGGDMIVATPGKKNLNAVALVNELAEKYPMFYALGNHEYRAELYPDKYGTMYQDYFSAVKESGVKFLRNTSACDEDGILYISGLEIEREYYKRFETYPMADGYVEDKIGPAQSEKFHIVLAHNPEYFANYAKYGADLILSGHVHGGVVRLPFVGGCASPAIRLFPKYSDGLYTLQNKKMVVSCGLGSHTIPMRIFNPGELTVISLKPEEESDTKA